MGRSRRRDRRYTECRGCGRCCEQWGGTLAAEESDLKRWHSEGREDLLRRVGKGGRLWIDPASGEDSQRCPFLQREGPDSAWCSIHETKPDMCRDYPTIAHGLHCARGIRFEERRRGPKGHGRCRG